MVLLFALIASAQTVLAAVESLEGKPISAIEFDPAAQPYPRAELDQMIPFHPGEKYQSALIRAAIQRLYSTGRYADIAVDAQNSPEGVAIKFITKDTMFVGRVAADGAPDPPSSGQLVTATKLQLGTEFANNDVPPAVESIQDRLRANGLYDAKVTPELTRNPDIEQINIDFRIDPGDRARFAGLTVEGDPERPVRAIIRPPSGAALSACSVGINSRKPGCRTASTMSAPTISGTTGCLRVSL